MLPNLSPLQAGYAEEVYDRIIGPGLNDFLGPVFERICREAVQQHGPELFGEPVREVGKIWGSDFDLDVAGETLGRIPFFGECKWSARPVGRGVLEEISRSAALTPYGAQRPQRYEVLFSRAGFTSDVQQLAGTDRRLILVGPDWLVRGTAPHRPQAFDDGVLRR